MTDINLTKTCLVKVSYLKPHSCLREQKSKLLGQRQKRNKTSGKSIMSAIFILKRVLPFLPSEQPDTSIYANMGMVNLARIPHQQIHLWFFYQLLVASLIVCCLKLSPCKFSRYTCYMNTYFQSCQPSLFFIKFMA